MHHNFHSYFLPYFFLHCIFDPSIIRINIIIATVLCNAESWYDIEEFGRSIGRREPRTTTYVSECLSGQNDICLCQEQVWENSNEQTAPPKRNAITLHHLSYLRRRMYCKGHSHTLECQKRPALTARHDFSIKMHSASSAIPPAISRGSDAAEELSTQEYLKTKRKLAT